LNFQERTFLEESRLFAEQEVIEREAQRQRELQASRQLAYSERVRAEQQASANRRLRQRSLFLLIAFLLAGLLAASAGFFWSQSAQANRLATSRELAAAAVNNIAIDPERSVLLALEALGKANTLEARNALRQTLPELHLLRTIEAKHEGGSPGTAYSPDGSRLASIGAFGDVKLWDSETGELIWELPAGNNELGYSLAFSPDGNYLAVAFRKGIALLDPDNGEEIYRIVGLVEGAPNNEVVHISISPDSRFLATANLDGIPTIIDLTLRKPVASLTGHSNPCDGVAFNLDGTLIATSDDSGVVVIWDAGTYQEIDRFQHSGNVHNIAFSPQGDKLASASEDGTLLVWDISNGDMLQRVSGTSGFYDVVFIPGSNRLAAAGQDGTTKIWDSDTGQLLLTLAGNTSTVISLSANEDGIRLVTSGYDGSLKIWDTTPGREINTTQGHSSAVWDISYSPDGNWLASVGDDGWVKIWNPSGNTLVHSVQLADHLSALTFSQDGHTIAVGSQSGTIYILDALTGKTITTLQGHSYLVFDLAFSPDNRLLISSSWDGTARLWDLALGKERYTFQGQWSGVAFSRDGASVFTGGLDRFVHRWDTASGSEIQRYGDGIFDPYAMQTNPTGEWIAVGYQDGSIIFYEISSSYPVRALAGHAGLINGLTFSRDGGWLASASFDRLAKVWSVDTGAEQFSLYGNTSNVFAVSFSEDGRLIATSGADGTVRTYTTQLDELVSIAKARVTRSLTEAECHKYLHQGCK
jgi:WD40 repeat protein